MKRFIKTSIALAMVLSLLLAFAGCATKVKDPVSTTKPNVTAEPIVETTYPLTFKDTSGNSVTIEKAPERIVTVGPNLTETIYALGKGNLVVGVTDYDDYPEQVKDVDKIGDLATPSLEKVIDLEPDVVFVSGTVMPESVDLLKQNNLTVVVINDHSNFEGVYDTILMVAKVLNANVKASEIVEDMKAKVSEIVEKVKALETPTVYYVVGYGEYGDYTATGDTFISFMIELVGGNNIAKGEKGWLYSKEALLEKDPSIIICSNMWDTKAGFTSAPGYTDLAAVKEDKVFEVDENTVTRQGPRLVEGLLELAKIIHPEAFK